MPPSAGKPHPIIAASRSERQPLNPITIRELKIAHKSTMKMVRNVGVRVDKMISFVDGVQSNGVEVWKSASGHMLMNPSVSDSGTIAEMTVKGALRDLRDRSELAVKAMEEHGLDLRNLEEELGRIWSRLQAEDAVLNRPTKVGSAPPMLDTIALQNGLKDASAVCDAARSECVDSLNTAREKSSNMEMAKSLLQQASRMLTAANSKPSPEKSKKAQETPASPPTDFPTLVLPPSPPKAPMSREKIDFKTIAAADPKEQAQMLKALAPQKVARPKAQRAPGEESPGGAAPPSTPPQGGVELPPPPPASPSKSPSVHSPGVLGRYIDPFQRIGGAPTDDSTPPRRRSRPSRAQERPTKPWAEGSYGGETAVAAEASRVLAEMQAEAAMAEAEAAERKEEALRWAAEEQARQEQQQAAAKEAAAAEEEEEEEESEEEAEEEVAVESAEAGGEEAVELEAASPEPLSSIAADSEAAAEAAEAEGEEEAEEEVASPEPLSSVAAESEAAGEESFMASGIEPSEVSEAQEAPGEESEEGEEEAQAADGAEDGQSIEQTSQLEAEEEEEEQEEEEDEGEEDPEEEEYEGEAEESAERES